MTKPVRTFSEAALAILDAMPVDPNATYQYEHLSGGFIWSDEFPPIGSSVEREAVIRRCRADRHKGFQVAPSAHMQRSVSSFHNHRARLPHESPTNDAGNQQRSQTENETASIPTLFVIHVHRQAQKQMCRKPRVE